MDESGDLGFDFSKEKTSRCFVITFLFVDNKKPIEKIVTRVFRDFSQRQRKHHPGTLHASKELPATRLQVLKELCRQKVSILSIHLNKSKVYTRLQDEKQVLYNYVTNILLDRIYTRKLIPLMEPIQLVASRRETNRFFNENFRNYLKAKVYPNQRLNMEVSIKRPSEEKCLQVADFACWAIFRKLEHGDGTYWSVIKEKIVEESALFPS